MRIVLDTSVPLRMRGEDDPMSLVTQEAIDRLNEAGPD